MKWWTLKEKSPRSPVTDDTLFHIIFKQKSLPKTPILTITNSLTQVHFARTLIQSNAPAKKHIADMVIFLSLLRAQRNKRERGVHQRNRSDDNLIYEYKSLTEAEPWHLDINYIHRFCSRQHEM